MTSRDVLMAQVRERLSGRRVVYFGTRGDDVEGIADLPELSAVFAVIGRYRRKTSVEALALEDITGRRVDLDAHDIDDEPRSEEVIEFRRSILRALARESVVFTYRPSTFLSAICFARQDRCTYAGMFKDHQAAFEHKPWVESEIRRLGVPAVPWVYVADEEQLAATDLLADGPVLVRRSRSSGGSGFTLLDAGDDLAAAWPEQDEIFASVAPFIPGGISTNVSAVVWDDGVTLHHPSVQLIGLPQCTNRPFGYCGNDFAAVARLEPRAVDQMESTTVSAARWLGERGYRGAFGVDFLVVDDQALFTEVNPRFQGVTHASCQIAADQGVSCVMLEHLAALLGLPAPTSRSLEDLVADLPPLANLVLHHLGTEAESIDGEAVVDRICTARSVRRADVVAHPAHLTEPGATIARLTLDEQITIDGHILGEPWPGLLAQSLSPLEHTHG